MSLNAASFSPDHIGDNDYRYYSDERRQSWAPANAWSGCWAGKSASLITTRDAGALRITNATDWTGNSRHWENDTLSYELRPYNGFTRDNWSTTHWILHGENSASSGGISAVSSLSAAGAFYLAAVCFNSRGGGNRQVWCMGDTNKVLLDQPNGRVSMVVNSSSATNITAVNAFPTTHSTGDDKPFLMEIWRDGSDVIHAARNNVEVGTNPTMAGTFVMDGFGRSGSAGWDDFLCEFFVCSAVPTTQERSEIWTFMRLKWDL
jgi:hypothetical protein